MTCGICGEVVNDQQLELDPAFARGDRPIAPNRSHQAGFGRPSRSTILQAPISHRPSVENARRSIASYARQLEVSSDFVDMAVNLFKLAVNNNSIAGSRPSVLCACLYAICRRENTPHMLFDFAAVSKESPFNILKNLKLICKSTHTTLPPPDPSFYIPRMVHELFAKLILLNYEADSDGYDTPIPFVNREVVSLSKLPQTMTMLSKAALYDLYCPDPDSTTISFVDAKQKLRPQSTDTLEEYRQAKYQREQLVDRITMVGLKILHTMSKEWISYGRRPIGVSAAAVSVACMQFRVKISLAALTNLSQLAPETIMRRVEEWQQSTAGALRSVDDYQGPSLKGVPPCFTRGLARTNQDRSANIERELTDTYFVICKKARDRKPPDEHDAREWREFMMAHCNFKGLPPPPAEALDLLKLTVEERLRYLSMNSLPPPPGKEALVQGTDPFAAVYQELAQAATGELAFKLAVTSFRGTAQEDTTPGAIDLAASDANANSAANPSSVSVAATPTHSGIGMDFPLSPNPSGSSPRSMNVGLFPSLTSPDKRFGTADEFDFDDEPRSGAGNELGSTSRAGSLASNMFLVQLGAQVREVQALMNADPVVSAAYKKAEQTDEEIADDNALVEAARDVLRKASIEIILLPDYQTDTCNPFDYNNTDLKVPNLQRSGTEDRKGSSLGHALGLKRSRSLGTDAEVSVEMDTTGMDGNVDAARIKPESIFDTRVDKIGLMRSQRNTGESEPDPVKVESEEVPPPHCPDYLEPSTLRAHDLAEYIVTDLNQRLEKDKLMCRALGTKWSKEGAAKSLVAVKALEFRAAVSDYDLTDPTMYEVNPPIISSVGVPSHGQTTSQFWSQAAEADDDDFGDFGRNDFGQRSGETQVVDDDAVSVVSTSFEERVRSKKQGLIKSLLQFSNQTSATFLALAQQNPALSQHTNQLSQAQNSNDGGNQRVLVSSADPSVDADDVARMTSQTLFEDPSTMIAKQRSTLATMVRKQRRRSRIGFIYEKGSAQESLQLALKGRGGAQIDVAAVFGDADDNDDEDVDGDGDFAGGDDDWA